MIVGASDGIGAALARRLLAAGWRVAGVSRSGPAIEDPGYRHEVVDVRDAAYPEVLRGVIEGLGAPDACIYCAGIGELLDLDAEAPFAADEEVFAVNVGGLARTVAVVVPAMIAAGGGRVVGLSSQADRWIDEAAPSYAASKAAMSSYLYGLARALRPRGVRVTCVRLGFVATKMARAEVRPFEMSAEKAAAIVERAMEGRAVRVTRPRRMAALLWLAGIPRRIALWLR